MNKVVNFDMNANHTNVMEPKLERVEDSTTQYNKIAHEKCLEQLVIVLSQIESSLFGNRQKSTTTKVDK